MDGFEKIIYVADDNENDRNLILQALGNAKVAFKIQFAENGQDLFRKMENLYSTQQIFPRMILLDFNMKGPPSGLDILKMLKAHFLFKVIPVLVLSSEKTDEYLIEAYSLGANSFIVKPPTLKGFEDFIQTLNKYWFELADIPTSLK